IGPIGLAGFEHGKVGLDNQDMAGRTGRSQEGADRDRKRKTEHRSQMGRSCRRKLVQSSERKSPLEGAIERWNAERQYGFFRTERKSVVPFETGKLLPKLADAFARKGSHIGSTALFMVRSYRFLSCPE